jgi:ATP-dependent protease ClpP protease subunit
MKALCFVLLVGCAPAHVAGFRAEAQSAPTVGAADIGPIDVNVPLLMAAKVLESAPSVVLFKIDSPGGDVGVGLAFIDLMRAAQAKGSVIHCTIPAGGMAASMAAVIFEQCDVRTMKRGAALMFHTVSVSGVGGNQWDLERLTRQMASWNKQLAILAVAKMRITLSEYEERTHDFDWWLDRDEAAEVGAAD